MPLVRAHYNFGEIGKAEGSVEVAEASVEVDREVKVPLAVSGLKLSGDEVLG